LVELYCYIRMGECLVVQDRLGGLEVANGLARGLRGWLVATRTIE